MTDRAAAAGFTLLLTCFTAYLCFRGIAWVIQNGWRSMLGLVALRGEAVLTVEDSGRLNRWAWDSHCVDAVLLTHEADEDLSEDNEAYADDFIEWAAEIRERTQ